MSRCDEKANCTNTDGSYNCSCNHGYEGDGFNCTGNKMTKVYGFGFQNRAFKIFPNNNLDFGSQSKCVDFLHCVKCENYSL